MNSIVCCPAPQLDYAKRHLTHTITSLRRLAMLTAAVDDLEQVRNHSQPSHTGLDRCAALCTYV